MRYFIKFALTIAIVLIIGLILFSIIMTNVIKVTEQSIIRIQNLLSFSPESGTNMESTNSDENSGSVLDILLDPIDADTDGDGFSDGEDNCPYISNPGQEDSNGDGIGDICYHEQGACGGTIECFCSDRVEDDYVMLTNLRNRNGGTQCTKNGLVVGKHYNDSGVKAINFDCAGYELYGNKDLGYSGLRINNSRASHIIQNCTIQNFDYGVRYGAQWPEGTVTVKDLKIFNNKRGLYTGGRAPINIFNSEIYDNELYGITSDEAKRYKIKDSYIHDNPVGIAFHCSSAGDYHNIHDNIIENNGYNKPFPSGGIIIHSCSHSNFINNTIINNSYGMYFRLGINAMGRSNDNKFIRNTISQSTIRDFWIEWYTASIGNDSKDFQNNFTNNSVNGKDIMYEYGISDDTFEGLDLHAFICMTCTNITLNNSNIREMYFAYSNDSYVENIFSRDAYYSIYKVESDRIDFLNVTIMNNQYKTIEEVGTNEDNVYDINIVQPECSTAADCDDGLFCNGAEQCIGNICQSGTPPVCNDGISCTNNNCNEANDECEYTENHASCDNGIFCDGLELCSIVNSGCIAGTSVDCTDSYDCTNDICDESINSCDNTENNVNCPLYLEGQICDIDNFLPPDGCGFVENCTDMDQDGLFDYEVNYCPNGLDSCPYTNDTYFINNPNELALYFPDNGLFNISEINESNILNISNFSVVLENIGRIEFIQNLNLIRINETGCFEKLNFSYTGLIQIEDGKIFLNSSFYSEFNNPAKLTFLGINFIEPVILKDGIGCSACNIINYTKGVLLKVEVPGFSIYEVVEGYTAPSNGNGGGNSGGRRGGGSGEDNETLPPINPLVGDCILEWTCTDFSECVNGTQTRDCSDTNNCGIDDRMPTLEQECDITNIDEKTDSENIIPEVIIPILTAILIIFMILWTIKKRRHSARK